MGELGLASADQMVLIGRLCPAEHVRGKVREALVAGLPDEELDRLIRKEFDSFFTVNPNTPAMPSPFGVMVRAVLQAADQPQY